MHVGLLPFEQSKGESFLLCRTAGSHRLGGQSGAKAVLCYQLRLNVTSQTHKNTAIYVSGLRRPVHTAAAALAKIQVGYCQVTTAAMAETPVESLAGPAGVAGKRRMRHSSWLRVQTSLEASCMQAFLGGDESKRTTSAAAARRSRSRLDALMMLATNLATTSFWKRFRSLRLYSPSELRCMLVTSSTNHGLQWSHP